jgi:hypothetical protein
MSTASPPSPDPCPFFQAEIATTDVIVEYETETGAVCAKGPNFRDSETPE